MKNNTYAERTTTNTAYRSESAVHVALQNRDSNGHFLASEGINGYWGEL